ncbi:OsmC family protein [Mesorhizobium caraganae]|uniref:OsmC family protein n=1 Tax=Mesorhizobium caraganae TaxID=483206 RepID=UPI00177C8224|nr:OsmC family protein [Mesorhizobium caraganae]
MAELKVRTRETGALAVMPPGGLPVVTTPTGGSVDVVTGVNAPGFNPLDLLYASLAACMVLSARIAATRLGVAANLGEVRADVRGEKAEGDVSRVASLRWSTPHPSRRCAPMHLLPQGEKVKPRPCPQESGGSHLSSAPL